MLTSLTKCHLIMVIYQYKTRNIEIKRNETCWWVMKQGPDFLSGEKMTWLLQDLIGFQKLLEEVDGWLITNSRRRARWFTSFSFRALYISSVSITTNLFTCCKGPLVAEALQILHERPRAGNKSWLLGHGTTCWSIPWTVGVFHLITVRLHLRRRRASRVRLWSLLVPGVPLTRVM